MELVIVSSSKKPQDERPMKKLLCEWSRSKVIGTTHQTSETRSLSKLVSAVRLNVLEAVTQRVELANSTC